MTPGLESRKCKMKAQKINDILREVYKQEDNRGRFYIGKEVDTQLKPLMNNIQALLPREQEINIRVKSVLKTAGMEDVDGYTKILTDEIIGLFEIK